MARKKTQRPKTLKIRVLEAYDLPGLIEEGTRISIKDNFEHGPWAVNKGNWELIAAKLKHGEKLWPVEIQYLVRALQEMADTGDANRAFGTKRKGIAPQYVKSTLWLVEDLMRQGLTANEAWEKVANFDLDRNVFRNTGGGEALRKKITRAAKLIWSDSKDKKR